VVFSFDGDAAGRRAATRALEASLPHATDTRTVRFLFLPTEHDPDSYVRAFGAEAFERCVATAVPLSRQLLEAAADGCDLESAEGRARLVAQARPLIAQLPDGLLRAQIVEALAAAAHVAVDTLTQRLTTERMASGAASDAAKVRPREPAASPTFAVRRPALRRPLSPMATSLDRAVWLLIQRTDAWERLGHEAHELLTAQAPPHGRFFTWLDRLIHDQGPLAPAALAAALDADGSAAELQQLHDRVRGFHDVPADDGVQAELEVIIDRLRLQATQAELELLAGTEGLSEAARARQRELIGRQRALKERLSRPAAVGESSPPRL
jgi:DNA primase